MVTGVAGEGRGGKGEKGIVLMEEALSAERNRKRKQEEGKEECFSKLKKRKEKNTPSRRVGGRRERGKESRTPSYEEKKKDSSSPRRNQDSGKKGRKGGSFAFQERDTKKRGNLPSFISKGEGRKIKKARSRGGGRKRGETSTIA